MSNSKRESLVIIKEGVHGEPAEMVADVDTFVIEVMCNRCNETYSSSSEYDSHLESCSSSLYSETLPGSNPYDFRDDSVVSDRELLADVLEKPHNLPCPYCVKLFKYESSLNVHVEKYHSDSKDAIECNLCNFRCVDEITFVNHCSSHQPLKKFKCHHCKTKFTRRYHLVRHLEHTGCGGFRKNTFQCQVCDFVFTRKDNLREHLRNHVNNLSSKEYICDTCKKVFNKKPSLIVHIRNHAAEKSFKCQVCDTSFKVKSSLIKHERQHTGEKPYSCDKCKKVFAAKETLNRHLMTHVEDKPFACSQCNKTFIQQMQLKQHMFYHTGKSDFKCKYCNVYFVRKTRLVNHEKYVHEGAEKIGCTYSGCNKKFEDSQALKRHLSTHSDEKPFKCKKCNKSFRTNILLYTHERIHRREVARMCPKCPRAFIRADCMLRHLRSKHSDLYKSLRFETNKLKLKNMTMNLDNIMDSMDEQQ